MYFNVSLSTDILLFMLFDMTIVFERFISRPTRLLAAFGASSMVWSCLLDSDKRTKSSAKRRWLKYLPLMLSPALSQFKSCIIDSRIAINSFGDSGSPCFTPLSIGNVGPVDSSFILALLLL